MASQSLVFDSEFFFKPVSKFKGVETCDEHIYVERKAESNCRKRSSSISKRYVLEKYDGEESSFITVGSSGKGSRSYSYKLYRRINGIIRPRNSTAIMATFTWGRSVGCIACAYKGIALRWRSFRQNFRNRNLPNILAYIGSVEPHKSYYPHLHFLLFLDRPFTREETSSLHEIWGSRVDVQFAKKPVNYIVKYINKSQNSLYFMSFLSVIGCRQFFFSRGFVPSWRDVKNDDSKYTFLGETELDLRLFSEFHLHYHITGERTPLNDYTFVSQTKDVQLWAK